jgi:hypothetical protein
VEKIKQDPQTAEEEHVCDYRPTEIAKWKYVDGKFIDYQEVVDRCTICGFTIPHLVWDEL